MSDIQPGKPESLAARVALWRALHAQRRSTIASQLRVFEIDAPGPQLWKRNRLVQLGFGIPEWLRFVAVDLEASESWRERPLAAGFGDTPRSRDGRAGGTQQWHAISELRESSPRSASSRADDRREACHHARLFVTR